MIFNSLLNSDIDLFNIIYKKWNFLEISRKRIWSMFSWNLCYSHNDQTLSVKMNQKNIVLSYLWLSNKIIVEMRSKLLMFYKSISLLSGRSEVMFLITNWNDNFQKIVKLKILICIYKDCRSLMLGFFWNFSKTFCQHPVLLDKIGRQVDIKLRDGSAFLPGLPYELLA